LNHSTGNTPEVFVYREIYVIHFLKLLILNSTFYLLQQFLKLIRNTVYTAIPS